jgi:hypothetical protein
MPSMKFPNFMELICNIIDFKTSSVQGAADQQYWWDSNEKDDV